jgi:A/G-specific adenine glycosylase
MLQSRALFARRLLRWYDRNRRLLPWRTTPGSAEALDPYHVLLSESMLQQTQVATVIPYFHRFLARLPTLHALAHADEQEVLRLWQGLGYYSRARNLHATARIVLRDFGGQMPGNVADLVQLPGIGRYTAGAIASIAFGKRAPILDGNVQRVLCRLDCVQTDPRDRQTQQALWQRAEEILPGKRIGDFNSALMELGATVCTPRTPQCLSCPVREHCQAFAAGVQEQIPAPKKTPPTPLIRRRTWCIRSGDRWLIEQRPPRGRWAGMWQFVTTPLEQGMDETMLPVRTTPPQLLGTIAHALTHRRYQFEVYVCEARGRKPRNSAPRRWVTLIELGEFPLPRPHVKIVELLRNLGA